MSSTRKARSLVTQTAELALAGATPSARDRKEFHLMGAEKVAAFQESWMAMAMQAWRAQMQMQTQLWTSAMQAMWMPWSRPASFGGGSALAQWQKATLGILGQGMAPVHRRAVGNAKRLGRTRLR